MAQAHRLLNSQEQYLSWIVRKCLLKTTWRQVIVGTWGMYSWSSFCSPVCRALEALQYRKALVLVGAPGLDTRILAAQKRFPELELRLSPDVHSKYCLFQDPDGSWIGAAGSWNLVDSGQWNTGVKIDAVDAGYIAKMHFAHWYRAKTVQQIAAVSKNLGPLQRTVYSANDIGASA